METCLYCNEPAYRGIVLSNGEIVHSHCISFISKQKFDLNAALSSWQNHLEAIKKKLRQRKELGFKILALFSKPDIDTGSLRESLFEATANINKISLDLSHVEEIARFIYDYYPNYPPDWDERRITIITHAGGKCRSCGAKTQLHIHHRIPLSKGGTNKLENLIPLCEKCHSKAHSNRDLNQTYNKAETAFQRRLEEIHAAIKTQKKITFGYKKPTDSEYHQRVVRPPYKLDHIKHYKDDGATLCLRAYCENRRAERVFALKRMRGLKAL